MDITTLRVIFLFLCIECIILEIYTDYLNSSFKVHRSYAYLTNWGLFLGFLYFYFQVLLVWLDIDYRMCKKVISNVFKVAINIQLVICVTFWTIMAPIAFQKIKNDKAQIILNIQTHSLVLFILWVDLAKNKIRIKQKDYIRTWIFYTVYVGFNYLIVRLKGKYVYPVIKYEKYSELFFILAPYFVIYLSNRLTIYYQENYKVEQMDRESNMQLKQSLSLSYQEHL